MAVFWHCLNADAHYALYACGCCSWNKRVFIAYANSVFLSFSQLSLSQLAVASHYPTLSHTAGSPWQQQLPAPLTLSPMASAHQLSHIVRFPPTHSCNNTQNIHKKVQNIHQHSYTHTHTHKFICHTIAPHAKAESAYTLILVYTSKILGIDNATFIFFLFHMHTQTQIYRQIYTKARCLQLFSVGSFFFSLSFMERRACLLPQLMWIVGLSDSALQISWANETPNEQSKGSEDKARVSEMP